MNSEIKTGKEKFKKYSIVIGPSSLLIKDVNYLGDSLWNAFQNFYFYCVSNKELINHYDQPLPQELVSASYTYFEEIKSNTSGSPVDQGFMADQYFENFTPIWNLSSRRNKSLWYVVLTMVRVWEKKSDFQLHKGTPFYFWATTDLLHGDYDEGFILMHKALDEDRRKSGGIRTPDTPGHDFVSMNEKPGAYLQPLTKGMAEFIIKRLEEYHSRRSGILKYTDLRSKFLDNTDQKFENPKFFLSYTILKWMRLRAIHYERSLADDQMAPLILTGVISDLLLVIDELLKIAFSKAYKSRKVSFKHHLLEVAKLRSWTKAKDFTGYQNQLSVNLNDEFTDNFRKIVENLLIAKVGSKQLKPLEADLWLCYGLRNFTAHNVSSQKVLWEKFTEVLQSILNVFFLSVETL